MTNFGYQEKTEEKGYGAQRIREGSSKSEREAFDERKSTMVGHQS